MVLSQQACHELLFDGPDSFHLGFVLIAGRVLLSWLPPGEIGSHRARGIGMTLVTSAAVGTIAAWVLSPLPMSVAAGVVLVLALARRATLPAAMVPRHPPRRASLGLAGRAGVVLCVLVLGFVTAVSFEWIRVAELLPGRPSCTSGQLRPALLSAGILQLVVYGGRVARRSLSLTCLLASALFLCPASIDVLLNDPRALENTILLAAGMTSTVLWLRRADRRARMIAVLAYTALAALGEGGLGLALSGWAGLIIFTPKPTMSRTATFSLAGLLAALVLGRASFADIPTTPSLTVGETVLALVRIDAYPLFIALAVLGLAMFTSRGPSGAGRGDDRDSITPPSREAAASLFILASCILTAPFGSAPLLPIALAATFAAMLCVLPAESNAGHDA